MDEWKRDFKNVINKLVEGVLNLNERVHNLEKITYQILKYIEEKEKED